MTGSLASFIAKLRMRQLALVVAVADKRSLRAAAEALYVSQPAATKMLREVESTLGAPVFDRVRGGMSPTATGEAVIRYARAAVADLRRLHEEVGEIESGEAGHVSVGNVLAPEPIELSRALARFKAQRPAVTVSLQMGTSDALIPRLLAAELDAVIGRLASRTDVQRLEFHELAEERLALIAGADSGMGRRRWTARELQGLQWVLLPAGTPLRRALDDAFMRRGLDPPVSVVETNSMFTVMSLLQNSSMVSAVSERTARHFARAGGIELVASNLRFVPEPYGILLRKGRPSTPAAHALLTLVREEMRSEAAR